MTGNSLAVALSDLYYRFRKLAQNDFGHTIAYKVRNRIGCYSLIEETYFSIQFFIVLLHQDVRDCVYILALAEIVSITKRLGNKKLSGNKFKSSGFMLAVNLVILSDN